MRALRSGWMLVGLAVPLASCSGGGGDEESAFNAGHGSSDASANGSEDGGTSSDASGESLFDAGPTVCTSSADCDGGSCFDGVCCASAASVCGEACCPNGTVCLFDKCVAPGKTCHTANDCGAGQYCETGLGTPAGDAGAPDAGDAGTCTQPLPVDGRCLDLPPVCDPDAGIDAGCVPVCEYHPSAGALDAEVRWQWGPTAQAFPGFTDVWATPAVGRIVDANCDGQVDEFDAPNVVVVSGKAIDAVTGLGTCCQCTKTTPVACVTGVLRMLDGRTGQEVWSLDKAGAGSTGFAGLSVAIGDVDRDGRMDVVAVTGEGYVVLVDALGHVARKSDKPIPNRGSAFGWGGGLALADLDADGFAEIVYASTVFTTTSGAITLKFTGGAGIGGGATHEALSTVADLDGAADGHLELLAGRTAYRVDGTTLWNRTDLPDGFPAVADFDRDGQPEAVLVANGKAWVLDGATGATRLGPLDLPGTGSGGPPTIADFDGDGAPEIGVAMATFYSVLKPDFAASTLDVLWKTANHDLSSSVTGSSVFDFEGDGRAEVIYNDECFLWVFDGQTGAVRFAAPTSSFTGTEASLVADVDGDGRAEMLMIANGADPGASGWGCMDANGKPVTVNGVTWTPSSAPGKGYRGITVFGSHAHDWVGTRALWNQHTYHVTNICDARDSACDPPNASGSIPQHEKKSWSLPWVNSFRQNVQDHGLFDAPNATVSLAIACSDPPIADVSVRNAGLATLPAGVEVGVFLANGDAGGAQVGSGATTQALFPGQTEKLSIALASPATKSDTCVARILVDPNLPSFRECRDDDDESAPAHAVCPH